MAVLEQAIASTSLRNLLFTPQNPSSRLTIPSGIQCSNHSLASVRSIYSRCWRQSKTRRNGRLKCSMDDFKDDFKEQSYGDDHYNQVTVAYPKPSEIPWNKELCNSVNLIGVVATPIETKHFPSGKVTAWTRLAVRKNATQTSWINLTFWDELAHIAFQHLEKGHQIYVSGRLVTDTVESDDGKQNTYYKVVCQQLNFIERSPLSSSSYDQEPDSMISGSKGNYAALNTGSVEELWQAFFANPVEWWDNRKNKRNPKYPDFKHKDTGEALWVEGRSNPPWVKSQLAILDARMGSLTNQHGNISANMVTVDELLSF
ncbi:protein OSB1, mitochondrial-like [Neltuma alba]|uniref:protein OSB1, mitochondrial-like n=1 Tax=Neltuma alba TaxID=207710 RepID=UPI0010A343E7|nr:protein OSB1, mitochondrial-like [Prosopis alba]XP_028792169.1 protein OSB1, mitochondrial-like [Prosopis alba]